MVHGDVSWHWRLPRTLRAVPASGLEIFKGKVLGMCLCPQGSSNSCGRSVSGGRWGPPCEGSPGPHSPREHHGRSLGLCKGSLRSVWACATEATGTNIGTPNSEENLWVCTAVRAEGGMAALWRVGTQLQSGQWGALHTRETSCAICADYHVISGTSTGQNEARDTPSFNTPKEEPDEYPLFLCLRRNLEQWG